MENNGPNKALPILVTGAAGFVGKNLVATLKSEGYTDLMLFDVDTPKAVSYTHLDVYKRQHKYKSI